MKFPLCFCNGVIRSGSTWSFNVCRGLFQELANTLGKPFGSAYLDGPYVEQFVCKQWASAPGPTVIKAHMIGNAAFAAICSGQAKGVCTFRDPRDCLASDLVFMNSGVEESVRRLVGSLEFLKHYQVTQNILLVKYEQMLADRFGQIRRIAAHLGIQADESVIQRVDARTNLQACQQICEQLKHKPDNQVLHIASHRIDPQTHLHEQHIGRVKPGRWKEEFSAEQGRWVTEYFAPWLIQLGYETPESLRAILQGAAPQNAPQPSQSFSMPAAISSASSNVARPGTFSIGSGLLQSQAG